MVRYTFTDILKSSALLLVGGALLTTPLPLFALSPDNQQLYLLEKIHREIPVAQTATPKAPLTEGIYLYGSSAQAEEIGQEYLVFQVEGNKATGAIYSPRSEFSCFSGDFEPKKLNLAIVDPYSEAIYSYAIAFEEISNIASASEISRSVTLAGYHSINQISSNDQRILNTCLDYYRQASH
jgi:hypothetical protein